jgi:hypothetical protein
MDDLTDIYAQVMQARHALDAIRDEGKPLTERELYDRIRLEVSVVRCGPSATGEIVAAMVVLLAYFEQERRRL